MSTMRSESPAWLGEALRDADAWWNCSAFCTVATLQHQRECSSSDDVHFNTAIRRTFRFLHNRILLSVRSKSYTMYINC